MERQHRAIEEHSANLRSLTEGGSTQEDDLITIRGDHFVIPVKAEFKRRDPRRVRIVFFWTNSLCGTAGNN